VHIIVPTHKSDLAVLYELRVHWLDCIPILHVNLAKVIKCSPQEWVAHDPQYGQSVLVQVRRIAS